MADGGSIGSTEVTSGLSVGGGPLGSETDDRPRSLGEGVALSGVGEGAGGAVARGSREAAGGSVAVGVGCGAEPTVGAGVGVSVDLGTGVGVGAGVGRAVGLGLGVALGVGVRVGDGVELGDTVMLPDVSAVSLLPLLRARKETASVPAGNRPDHRNVTPLIQSPPVCRVIGWADPPTITFTQSAATPRSLRYRTEKTNVVATVPVRAETEGFDRWILLPAAETGVADTAKDRAMATITAAKASAPRASFRRRPSGNISPQLARTWAGASRRMWGVNCPGQWYGGPVQASQPVCGPTFRCVAPPGCDGRGARTRTWNQRDISPPL